MQRQEQHNTKTTTVTPTHLALAKERDRLAELPQHRADFGVIGGHDRGADLAAQLELGQQLLLLLAAAPARLFGVFSAV
jgi:hypothetical protein